MLNKALPKKIRINTETIGPDTCIPKGYMRPSKTVAEKEKQNERLK